MKFPTITKTGMAKSAKIHRNSIFKLETGVIKSLNDKSKEKAKKYLLEKIEEIKAYIKFHFE